MTADRIYRRHLTELHYCARGCRLFFERHGIDWSEFLRNGVPRSEFIRTGDAMALRAVELADKESARGQ